MDRISDAGDHDQIWGAAAIAAAINCSPRRAFYLLESGKLRAKKVGKLWTASRRQLLADLNGADKSVATEREAA